jgi:Fe-S-cluster-containing dehydrogenase component/DMSO reductase anchor subunit
MRKGFIFNHNKCVACNACSAACVLENGWTVHPRQILTYNSDADSLLPIINLSLACNHCENAVCMDGCPASAFSQEATTGAILIDDKKCIGCRYCQWNCPYDAPKYDIDKRVILKCNLCNSLLSVEGIPACASGCPTGALQYGDIDAVMHKSFYSWFPEKNLSPSIEITSTKNINTLRLVPEQSDNNFYTGVKSKSKNIYGEISLIIFSFLATLSVSMVLSSVIRGSFPDRLAFISLLVISGLVSIFHLGKVFRFWRSVTNIKKSPLSLEIASFIIYGLISLSAVILQLPAMLIAATVAGLALMFSIDRVYSYANGTRSIIGHSGQTFLSALIITSFFSGTTGPFIFIAVIKLFLSGYKYFRIKSNDSGSTIRFARIALLVVATLSLILRNSSPDLFIIIIFLTGELLDRILFYIDFSPLNINTLIQDKLIAEKNEKKKY